MRLFWSWDQAPAKGLWAGYGAEMANIPATGAPAQGDLLISCRRRHFLSSQDFKHV